MNTTDLEERVDALELGLALVVDDVADIEADLVIVEDEVDDLEASLLVQDERMLAIEINVEDLENDSSGVTPFT